MVITFVFLSIALAGCSEPDPAQSIGTDPSEPAEVAIPSPATGETYRYEASNGDALNVTVGGRAERRDPWLNSRQGISLEMVHWDGRYDRGGEGWGYEETVDARGLVVQHWANCAASQRLSGEEHWGCVDDRGLAIPSAHGLPGGQGAAVFWGENLTPGEADIGLDTVLPGNEAWTYRISARTQATFEARACLGLEPAGVEADWIRSLAVYGGAGSVTLCEGLALPAAFDAIDGPRYRLVAHEPGTGPSLGDREPESFPREATVGMTERAFPLYAAHPERETPFPTEEAHEVARERVDSYDQLFRSSDNATLVHSWYDDEGGSGTGGPIGLGETTEHRRRIAALDDRGRWVSLAVEKTIHDPGDGPGQREESFEVLGTERSTVDGDVPTRSSLHERQADLDDAITLGERLTGQKVDEEMGFGLWPIFKAESHVHEGEALRPNGSTLIVWYEDHDPETSKGAQVEFPMRFTMDGPTATVLSVEGPRDRLNETMR